MAQSKTIKIVIIWASKMIVRKLLRAPIIPQRFKWQIKYDLGDHPFKHLFNTGESAYCDHSKCYQSVNIVNS
jgi:hypothetical protein